MAMTLMPRRFRPSRGARQAVLLLGNYRPALVAARKLSAAGYDVVLGRGGGEGGVEHSRFVARAWDHACARNEPEEFLRQLARLLEATPQITTVLPVAEEFVVLLARRGAGLSRNVTLASPQRSVVGTFWDKLRAFDLAREAGVPCLAYARVDSYRELRERSREIGFPLIVRPIGITARMGHKKAEILACEEQLAATLPAWPEGQSQLLLQKYARGTRHNVYFAARNGHLLAVVESRIRRTDHRDGTGLAVDGETVEPSPALLGDTRALVAAAEYTGIGLAQYIVDPASGERCFLELNPRVSGSHAVPEAAGLPLTELAVALARGEDGLPEPGAPVAGLRYAWTYGDLRGLKAAIAGREIGLYEGAVWIARLLETACRADLQMSWSWSDPLPELVLFARQIPGLRRLTRPRPRPRRPDLLAENAS